MSRFERYLTLWVALCIVAGIALGHAFPALFQGEQILAQPLVIALLAVPSSSRSISTRDLPTC